MVFDIFAPITGNIFVFIFLLMVGMMLLGFTGGSFSVGIFGAFTTLIYLTINLPIPFIEEILYITMFAIIAILSIKLAGLGVGNSSEVQE